MSTDRSHRLCRALPTLGVASLFALVVVPASAAVSYRYVTDTPGLTLSPSQSATVNIFLEEDLTLGSASLLAAEQGIVGAAFQTSWFSGLASPTIATSITPALAGPSFSGAPATNSRYLLEGIPFADTTGAGGTVSGSTTCILLGTIHLQAGTDAGLTLFSLAGYQNNTLTFTNGYTLDQTRIAPPAFTGTSDFNPPAAFSVLVVTPEPASITLLATSALLLLHRRAR